VIYDENKEVVAAGSGKAGNICIRNPWPASSDDLGAAGALRRHLLREVLPEQGQQGLATTGPTLAGDGAVQAPTATSDSLAGSTT